MPGRFASGDESSGDESWIRRAAASPNGRAVMDFEQRIQQFRKMAQEDPDNELGHFSLGKALLEAGRPGEAVESLSRVLTLNPKMSKSYQLLADACERAGDREKSIETLRRGIVVADEQGDRMPRDAMADMLRGFGATVPAFRDAGLSSPAVVDGGASTDGFPAPAVVGPAADLQKCPSRDRSGKKIFDHVCRVLARMDCDGYQSDQRTCPGSKPS